MSYTPMDFRHYTVPQLRKEIKERAERGFDNGVEPNADGTHGLPKPLSRMLKAELIDTLVRFANAQVKQEADSSDEVGEDLIGRLMGQAVEERRVTEAVDQVITEELGELAPTTKTLAAVGGDLGEALNTFGLAAREAARQLGAVAWAHMRATVHSMGHRVHGKVVDTVLRTPGPDGSGRVLLVVQHEGHPTRRTLHRLVDVDLTPLAS